MLGRLFSRTGIFLCCAIVTGGIMIAVSVLGSTGSIGTSTLDVIAQHRDKYSVKALSANTQVQRMAEQCRDFLPDIAVMVDPNAAQELQSLLTAEQTTQHITVLSGKENLDYIASLDDCDYVMAAIVGAAGLPSSIAAARAGKRVLLANKEALVMSGQLFMQTIKDNGAEILPIDSEHNAIFQSMPENYNNKSLRELGITKILLTASGGPFRTKALAELEAVTPEQACAHPNWVMGKKISVDSATMMNKGLEVIEASWLFNTKADDIQVVVHPESIIHSMVSYADGSVIAQLGNPDMRTPIAHSMAWPDRISSGVAQLDLFEIAQLNFEKPDFQRFPCLKLAYEALTAGGNAATILNAANEIAVDNFLNHKIPYLEIPKIISFCLEQSTILEISSLDVVYESDLAARHCAYEYIQSRFGTH